MTNKKNNYNHLAPFYQLISRLIFGHKLLEAQVKTFQWVPSKGNILFIGGGDGTSLKRLIQVKPDLKITYLDKSSKMIDLAIAKLSSNELKNVEFIHSDIESYSSNKKFNLVLCYFFLDQFEPGKRKSIVLKIDAFLLHQGHWIITDFNTPRSFMQKLIEKTMFFFLKLSTQIESSKIEKVDKEIEKMNYTKDDFILYSRINLMSVLYLKV